MPVTRNSLDAMHKIVAIPLCASDLLPVDDVPGSLNVIPTPDVILKAELVSLYMIIL